MNTQTFPGYQLACMFALEYYKVPEANHYKSEWRESPWSWGVVSFRYYGHIVRYVDKWITNS